MGIDGIGKKGGVPGNIPAAPTTGPAKTGQSFEVGGAQKTEAVASVETGPLAEVRSGRMSVDAYLDHKVADATKHLSGLPSHELGAIKSMLRDQLASDPSLVELVQKATGSTPTPPEE
jgi:hypothetical protein